MNAITTLGSCGSVFGRTTDSCRRIARAGTLLLAVLILLGATGGRAGAASPELLDLVTIANDDVSGSWASLFAEAGYGYTEPIVILVDKSATSDCFTFKATSRFGICPREETIYLGARALDDIEADYGEFTVAVTIAEAYGYHVLNLFDVESGGIDRAVQAACLAGYWAAGVEIAGRVEPGAVSDVAETYAELYEDGDLLAQGILYGAGTEYANDCFTLAVTDSSESNGSTF